MGRKTLLLLLLLGTMLLSACGAQQSIKTVPTPATAREEHANIKRPTITPAQVVLQSHQPEPTPTPQPSPTPIPTKVAQGGAPPSNIPNSGTGAAPYGPPHAMTALEVQLTQQLFEIINNDRAARGLYAFTWSPTLAGGARLHSWNMIHCGFSHYCPDGLPPCTRVMNEGFPDQPVCGECIGYAGPYPTAYDGMHNIQESMVNEPLNGYHAHRDILLSTSFHTVGVGVVVDSGGYIWFTEDMLMR